MLGKLIKHEFKATSRIFLPLYLVLACVTLLGKLIVTSGIIRQFEAIEAGLLLIYIFFIVALFITTIIYLVIRFYKNLFTDEGYLMFTLPAKPWQLIISKLVSAFIWNMGSSILTLVSILFLIVDREIIQELSISYRVVLNYFESMGLHVGYTTFWIIIAVIVVNLYQILMIYTSIAIGQLMGKHRILGAFASYMIIYIIMQVISFVYMVILGFSNMNTMMDGESLMGIYRSLTGISLLISVITIIVFYLVTNYILNKKLNLE